MADQQPNEPTQPAPGTPTGGPSVRAREIRTGAGLEESRLNQDFIELLRKWGTPTLLVIVIASLAWIGYGRWQDAKNATRAAAFADVEAQLEAASRGGEASPDVLLRLAEDHAGQGAAPLMARLAAAEVWVNAAGRGLAPGAQIAPEGALKNQEDLLTAEQKADLLKKAQDQYDIVLRDTESDPAKGVFALRALFGMAAVAETRGVTEPAQWDEAKKIYERAGKLAESRGFSSIKTLADERLKSVDGLKNLTPILPKDKILSFTPDAPKIDPAALPAPSIAMPSGTSGTVTPMAPATPTTPAAPTTPASTPSPAPESAPKSTP